MKPIITVLAALSLSACSVVVDQRHLAVSDKACKDRGGMYKVTYSHFNGNYYVSCKDGNTYKISLANAGANQ